MAALVSFSAVPVNRAASASAFIPTRPWIAPTAAADACPNPLDCAHRKSPGVLAEIPHLMAGLVYRLAGAGGGSAEAVGCGMVIA